MKINHTKLARILAFAVLAGLALTLAACQGSATTAAPTETAVPPTATAAPGVESITLDGATVTASGLQYLELVSGTGAAPQAGDIISMHYIASLPDGTELANTYTSGEQPIITVWGRERLLPGWEEGIGLMNVGDKSKFVIPPDLAFGEAGSGVVPANSQVVIEMELLSTEPAPQPVVVSADKLTTTASGLQYSDLSVGDGIEAVQNSTVFTDYTIWVKTATGYDYIDSSTGYSALEFVVGAGDVVFPGWEEGVTGMKVGGKRYLIIPAELGLGDQDAGSIPANSVLVMEIELVNAMEPQVATVVDEKDYTTTASGLKYYDLVEGTGVTPLSEQTVVVHYTGWLEDGTVFDSSIGGDPFSFQLGTGSVIPGWDEGVSTMKIGTKRQLVIPAALAYGDTGAGGVIPPGATLIFEVELLEIQP